MKKKGIKDHRRRADLIELAQGLAPILIPGASLFISAVLVGMFL